MVTVKRTEKQKRLSFFLKFGSGDRLDNLPENTHDVCSKVFLHAV